MRRTALLLLALGLFACGDDSPTDTGSGGSDRSTTGATSGGPGSTGATSTSTSASSGDGGADGSGGATSTTSSSSDGGDASGGGGDTGSGGSAGVGCLQDLSAGHHEVSCEGGIAYDVEIPDACVDGPCGLVVDMHGYTMNADSEDENTGMRALGRERGYVVVQPTAPMDGFGLPSWDQAIHAPLVFAFLEDLASTLPIDASKVHAMGFSQGGGMTFRLICAHADFFASGAPIGALAGCEFEGANTPSEEVDILQVHGHADAVVNFQSVAIPQRDAALDAWTFGEPDVFDGDDDFTATRWTTDGGTDFEFWEHDYTTSAQVVFVSIEGHCVPGGTDFDGAPAGYSCEDEDTFVFGEIAIDFFESHRKD